MTQKKLKVEIGILTGKMKTAPDREIYRDLWERRWHLKKLLMLMKIEQKKLKCI